MIDYNFTGSETNRTSGWKFIYLRLGKPRLFSWGCVMFLFRYITEASAIADVLTYSPNCFRTIYQPVPKKSPRAALLDTPLPLEARLKNKRFVSLAASEGLVLLPFQFNNTIFIPYCSCKPTGRYTHLTLTVVFTSGVRLCLSFLPRAKIPGYLQYTAVILRNSPGTLLPVPRRSEDRRVDFSGATTTASGWLKLRLPAPVRGIR